MVREGEGDDGGSASEGTTTIYMMEGEARRETMITKDRQQGR